MAAGWAVSGRRGWPEWARQAALFGAVGMLPDIDLLFGAHSGPTHSIGAALIVAIVAWGASGFRARGATIVGLFAAYGTHIVLDWSSRDTSAPLGVMALWPFSRDYFMSPAPFMPAITRRYWLPGFWTHNLRALLFELVVLLPVMLAAWWGGRYRRLR